MPHKSGLCQSGLVVTIIRVLPDISFPSSLAATVSNLSDRQAVVMAM